MYGLVDTRDVPGDDDDRHLCNLWKLFYIQEYEVVVFSVIFILLLSVALRGGGASGFFIATPGSCTAQWQMGNRQEVEATGVYRAGDLHRECPLWKQGCQVGSHLWPLTCEYKMDVGVKFDSLIKAV